MKNKGRGLAAIIGGTTLALSVVSAMIIATRNQEQFKSKAEQIDLVTRLCGGSTDGNIRSFVKDGYTFSFQFSNVTFGTDTITIAAGGYLRCITAFNGLQSIDFGEKLTDLAVSAGKYTSNGVERYHYFAKDYDVDRLDSSYSFTSKTSSHFALQALDNPVTISSMDVNYSCSGSIDTPTVESLGAGYDNYTWFFKGGGSEATPFLIQGASDWTAFVNYEKNYTGFYFKLMSDFSTNLYDTKNFVGHFDGNGHTITVNYDADTTSGLGLFSALSGVGSVSNLTIDGIVKNTSHSTGAIVGIMKDARGVIDNCKNYASVTNTANFSLGDAIGGLVGIATDGCTITNCINYGNIQSAGPGAAGIIGSIFKSGASLTATVSGCQNFGNVTSGASGSKNCAGGIIGFTNYTALLMDNCQNGDETHFPVITGNNHVGGVVGCTHTSMIEDVDTSRIKNCKNYGTVVSAASSGFKTGGVVGSANIPVIDCSNYGAVSGNNGASAPSTLIANGTIGWIVGSRSAFALNNSSGNANYYGV